MRSHHILFAVGAVALVADSASASLVLGPQLNRSIMTDVTGATIRRRPWSAAEDGGTLEVANFRIHDIIDGKGFHISLSSPDRTPAGQKPYTYSKIYVHNVEVFNITRNPGVHNDFLKIDGLGLESPRETSIVVEDAYFHDGTALTTLIHKGRYTSITLRRIRVDNTTTPIQLGFAGDGYVKKIYIEDSPGIRVALMGIPGAIGETIVSNSPGASVTDARTFLGTTSGAKIIFRDGASTPPPTHLPTDGGTDGGTGGTGSGGLGSGGVISPPITTTSVPEPAVAGVLGIAGMMLARRRRAA